MKLIQTKLMKVLPLFFLCVLLLSFAGCANKKDLSNYLSECKSEIYYSEAEGFTLTASYSQKEHPYYADGIVGKLCDLFEVKFKAPDNSKEYDVHFTLGGKEYGGDASFESVRQEYAFSQSIPRPDQKEIAFTITDGEKQVTLTAASVKTESTLGVKEILSAVQKAEETRLEPLWSGGTFNAELYLRLTYRDGERFYFVAICDRSGNTYSMLLDADTGEVLATREN